MNKKPILITGSHRSGSTWIGKIIAASPKVRYIHEPFNIQKKYPPPLRYWFQYISNDSSIEEQQAMLDYIFSFISSNPLQIQKTTPFFVSPIKFLKEWRSRFLRRTLMKDPIALFSTEWLFEKLQCQVIISVRHPAAFIASLKVKEWSFPFHHLASQQELLLGVLNEYKEDIENASKHNLSLIDQGILLWNCFYSVVKKYQEKYANTWYFVTHEDLSLNPVEEFQKVFQFLEIDWNDKVALKIKKTTEAKVFSAHFRDSKKNIASWKNRLSQYEIEKIKTETAAVWKHFYTEGHW